MPLGELSMMSDEDADRIIAPGLIRSAASGLIEILLTETCTTFPPAQLATPLTGVSV